MMSLVFNQHRRYSKRLYNGLKWITDENGVLLEKASQRSSNDYVANSDGDNLEKIVPLPSDMILRKRMKLSLDEKIGAGCKSHDQGERYEDSPNADNSMFSHINGIVNMPEERASGTSKKSSEEVAGGCGLEVIDSEDDTSIDDIDDGEEEQQEEGGYSHCLMDTKSSDFSPRPQVDEIDFTNEKNGVMNKSHVSSRIPTTGLKKYPQKRCVVCWYTM